VHAVKQPSLFEVEGGTADLDPGIEIAPDQLALVGASVFRRKRHRDEITHVAHRRSQLDQPPVEKADTVCIEEEVAHVAIALKDRDRTACPDLVELDSMVDVELGHFGEAVAQLVPMVVQAELEHPYPHIAAEPHGLHPSGFPFASGIVFEMDMEFGVITHRVAGLRDADPRDRICESAVRIFEVLEQEHEAAVGFIELRDIGTRNAHRYVIGQIVIEERLATAHPRLIDRLASLRVEREHLEEVGLGE